MRCRGACARVDLTGRTILDLYAAANRLGCLAKDATDSGTGSVATGTLAQPFVGAGLGSAPVRQPVRVRRWVSITVLAITVGALSVKVKLDTP
jgi:hypothetical protein